MHRAGLTLLLFLALAGRTALAEETRSLDAHEHGHGTLNIAVEGDRLLLELEAPGADIVGFEHAAESAEDRADLAAAERTLADPAALFQLPAAAGCRLAEAEVRLLAEEEDAHEADGDGHAAKEEAAHEHEAKEEAAHEHEAKEEAAHEHEEHEEEGRHSEFHAVYMLTCRTPQAIDNIRFVYFERFPNAQELEVNIVTERGQTSYEVTRDRPALSLKGMM